MSMRTYGVESRGMVLKSNEIKDLLKDNKDFIRAVTNNETTDIEEVDFLDIVDYMQTSVYVFWVCEFEGYLLNDERNQELETYQDEDILIFELNKDTLYDKYNNREEIIEELKNTLKEFKISVDNEFIESHYGIVNGTYCG